MPDPARVALRPGEVGAPTDEPGLKVDRPVMTVRRMPRGDTGRPRRDEPRLDEQRPQRSYGRHPPVLPAASTGPTVPRERQPVARLDRASPIGVRCRDVGVATTSEHPMELSYQPERIGARDVLDEMRAMHRRERPVTERQRQSVTSHMNGPTVHVEPNPSLRQLRERRRVTAAHVEVHRPDDTEPARSALR